MLIQALLFIFVGIGLVINPEKKPEDLQTVIALISLLIGALSVLAYLVAPPFDKSRWELGIGLLILACGLFILFAHQFEPGLFPLFFSAMMFLHAVLYANAYWFIRHESGFWWLIFPLLGYSLFLVYLNIPGETFWSKSVLMLAGLQYIICGIVTLFLGFETRRLQIEFNMPIRDFGSANSTFRNSTK